jgi:SET domain-containing protein
MSATRVTKKRYRIGRSPIHGRGVFATTTIRSGTRVVEYLGEIITEEEADRRAVGRRHVWFFDLECGHYIDGDPALAGPCVNHSCRPNCMTEITDGRCYIVAQETIRRGEELTYDYRFEPDVDIWPCNCGARRCRGTINLRPRRRPKPRLPKKRR